MADLPDDNRPALRVELVLLNRMLGALGDGDVLDRLHKRVTSQLASAVVILGIPASPVVEIRSVEDFDDGVGSAGVGAWIEGRRCGSLAGAVAGHPAWSGPTASVEAAALNCVQAVLAQPGRLLAPAQGAALTRVMMPLMAAAGLDAPVEAETLRHIATAALDLRISIANRDAFALAAAPGLAAGLSQHDVAEDVIAALRPNVLAVRLMRDDLRLLTTASDPEPDQLSQPGAELWASLGVPAPRIEFIPADAPADDSLGIRVNHLFGRPHDRPSSMRQVAEAVREELLHHAQCFLDTRGVAGFLDQIKDIYPATFAIATERVGLHKLARVLRALVVEGVSIRDLKSIVEALIGFEPVIVDPSRRLLEAALPVRAQPSAPWLDDAGNLASAARIGMRRSVSARFARESRLAAYTIDPRLEQLLWETPEGDERWRDRLTAELAHRRQLAGPETPFALLVSADVRAAASRMVRSDSPSVPVLCYEELTPDVQVELLGTLPSSVP